MSHYNCAHCGESVKRNTVHDCQESNKAYQCQECNDLRSQLAASEKEEKKLIVADRRITHITELYREWQRTFDNNLVDAIFTKSISAINAACPEAFEKEKEE